MFKKKNCGADHGQPVPQIMVKSMLNLRICTLLIVFQIFELDFSDVLELDCGIFISIDLGCGGDTRSLTPRCSA